jgi:hypothetical protein
LDANDSDPENSRLAIFTPYALQRAANCLGKTFGNTKCSINPAFLMNRTLFIAILAVVAAAISLPAQAPQVDEKRQQLDALVKELRTQQSEMAANQAKIDEKVAALAETVRVSRIFASRGGR